MKLNKYLLRRYVALFFVFFLIFSLYRLIFPSSEHSKKKLLVFIVVDQFAYDYLERFKPELSGGLKWLLDRGINFSETRHEHALTATCSGHATLSTGQHPAKHGIIGNSWFDRLKMKDIYCVEDPLFNHSPRLMQSSAIGDWIKEKSRRAKVYAVSGKDRAAITLGGHKADAAFWLDRSSGKMISSDYYKNNNPDWVNHFNQNFPLSRFFGVLWKPLPVDTADIEKMNITELDQGVFADRFPHAFGTKSTTANSSFHKDIYASPYADEQLLEFTKALVGNEKLGRDRYLDLLAISFSVLDLVGHHYGPNSREVLDVVLRLDQILMQLFDFLDDEVGLDNIIISFSSDHGVQPYPEYLHTTGKASHREAAIDVSCFQKAVNELNRNFGVSKLFVANGYLDWQKVKDLKLKFKEIDAAFAKNLESCAHFKKLWTFRELLQQQNYSTEKNIAGHLYLNNFYAERSPDYIAQYSEKYLSTHIRGTTHDSLYDYNRHVPFIVVIPDKKPLRVEEAIATIDIAPSLATLLEVDGPDNLAGIDRLSSVLAE